MTVSTIIVALVRTASSLPTEIDVAFRQLKINKRFLSYCLRKRKRGTEGTEWRRRRRDDVEEGNETRCFTFFLLFASSLPTPPPSSPDFLRFRAPIVWDPIRYKWKWRYMQGLAYTRAQNTHRTQHTAVERSHGRDRLLVDRRIT